MDEEFNNIKMTNLDMLIYVKAIDYKLEEISKEGYLIRDEFTYYRKIKDSLINEILKNGNILNEEYEKQKEDIRKKEAKKVKI